MQRMFAGDVRGFRTEGHQRGHKKSSKQWCKKKRKAGVKGMQSIKDAQQMGSEKKRRTDKKQDKLRSHTKIYTIQKDRKSLASVLE